MKSRTLWTVAVGALFLVGCKAQQEPEPASPTPIPFQSDIYEPTPFPDQTAVPFPPPEDNPEVLAGYTGDALPPEAKPVVSSTSAKPSSGTVSKGQVYQPSRTEMHESLEDYGSWYETPEYGEVWTPRGAPADWKPYQNGHWVNSDEGWLWEASEPWGWLPYHYGNWVHYPRYGWVWVPGVEWAPSRVVWRANDQYVAWAPIPPGPRVDVTVIPPEYWIVVPAPRFLEPRIHVHILPPARLPIPLVSIAPIAVTRPGRVVYYPGPELVVVRRWIPAVPPPVRVVHWRYQVPVRYKRHYDRGYHRGWYKPAYAPPPPRGVWVDRKGGPGREIEVDRYGRAGRTEVEIEKHGKGHKEVEIEHRGPAGRTEVEIEKHGKGRKEVEVDHKKRWSHTEVEVDKKGRGRKSVEIERDGRRRDVEIEIDKKGKKRRVEVESDRH